MGSSTRDKLRIKAALKQLFLPLAVILFFACDLFPPDYVGSWVDEESWFGWTYALEFRRSEFKILIYPSDAGSVSASGLATSGVMSAGAGVMEATITGQEIGGTELADSELQAFVAYLGGAEYAAQYDISDGTMTLSGELVEKICSPLTKLQAVLVQAHPGPID